MKLTTDILINPNAFFESVTKENLSLKVPLLIVFIGAIIAGVQAYLIGSLTGKLMSALMPGMGTIIAIIAVIGAIIFTILIWVILTGVFYGISIPLKGQGEFKRCLQVTGYGCLPQIFGSVITLALSFLYLPKVVVPTISSAALNDPQQIQNAVTALMLDPAMVAYTQIATVISIVFLLWSANNWIFGMKHARNLSIQNAAIAVGVPVVIYICYMVFTMSGA